ncbi:MAG: N-acyl-D-amino-acid deacylase family protein [Candidatus Entotheonellia bacterium]
MYDLIIRNATVVDGTGNPWFRSDVAISGALIAAVGRVTGEAARVIDANGLCICPGFIDVHAHGDFTPFDKTVVDYKLRQGITTEVNGNCGFSAAPLDPSTVGLVRRYVEGFIAPEQGVPWNWQSLGEYLDSIARAQLAINIAPLIGHGALRAAAMGYEQRAPSAAELDTMQALMRESMEQGAFGLSTGLVYVPGTYAQTDEIVDIARVAARYGGLYATHMRNEGERLFEAFDEAIQIGRRAEIPVQISHHKAAGKPNHGKVRETLKRLEEERAHGLEITVDQYPYTAGSTTLASVLPPWAQDGGVPKILERLRDPAPRREIKTAMVADPQHGENMIRGCDWDEILIASVKSSQNKVCEGKSLQQIAEMRGEEPLECVFNLLLDEECAVAMIMFTMAEEDVRTVMRHPATMIGTDGIWSHGKPHPRIYGTYPRILGTYVREAHLLSLEEAVRKMTSFPAQKFGLWKKGIVREGMDADLVVFDPDTIAERSTFQDPHQYPAGLPYVILNGLVVVDQERYTGTLAGRVVKKYG